MSIDNDDVLIDGILRKDESCIQSLVHTYQDRIYGQAFRMLKNSQDAQEVSQDVFLKALRKLPEFERKCKLSSWLYSIAYTTCLDVLKKRKRNINEQELDDDIHTDWSDLEDSLSLLEDKEQSGIIDGCIRKLNPTDALLVELYHLQDTPTKEIAEITELSEGNIRIRLMRARKKLGALLQETLPTETIESYRYEGD